MDRVVAAVGRRGIDRFARIDHAGGARSAGLELDDEEVLVFGDPRVGTLLMQSDPAIGYELPLRVLVWTRGGATHVGYRPASDLASRYAVAGRAEVLARMDALLGQIVAEAAGGE
ncbi:MAG TPA: DUF302 domain-containing protein [Solirubrobacteraceae bacterium]|nr:DUF302 domain-containing protein [Solirubrobacteraceae bacterium]